MGGTLVDDMWAGQVGMGVAVDKRRERDISVWWDADADQAQDEAAAGHTKATRRPEYAALTQTRRCRYADADMERRPACFARSGHGGRHTEYGKPTQENPPGQPSLTWRGVASSRRREARYKEDVESGSLHWASRLHNELMLIMPLYREAMPYKGTSNVITLAPQGDAEAPLS